MRKKKFSLVCAATLALLVGLGAGLAGVLRHEPTFYRASDLPPSPERKELSATFTRHFAQLLVDITADRGKWGYAFTEAQINSFFAEDFVRLGEAENLRKLNITDPRVTLEDDRLRVAFRYGAGPLSAVVSYDVRVWLAPKEANVLAVEILSRRIGGLPISSQSLLNELSEVARRHNMEVTLYRHRGHPVALIRLQADRSRAMTNLECLKISPATLTVAGASPELAAELRCPQKGAAPSGN